MSVIKIEQFLCSDGTTFFSKRDADDHELIIDVAKKLMWCLTEHNQNNEFKQTKSIFRYTDLMAAAEILVMTDAYQRLNVMLT